MRDKDRETVEEGMRQKERQKERESLIGKQAEQLVVLGMSPEFEHVDWKKDKEWKMHSQIRHDSLFVDLAVYPIYQSIHPSLHPSVHHEVL